MSKASMSVFTIGIVLGFVGGIAPAHYASKPASAYVIDLNGDGRPDVIVRNRAGHRFVYLQQADGTYIGLDNELRESSESARRKILEKAEEISIK